MIKLAGTLTAALALVLTLGTAAAQETEDDPAQVEAGMAIFEANCASCHGTDGMGSTVGRNLTDVAVEQPDRTVHITSVTEGKGGMPPFTNVLSAEEIDTVISYVRLGFVSAEAGGQDDEGDGEAAEDELAVTGTETLPITVAAVTLAAAGAMVVAATRRRPDIG